MRPGMCALVFAAVMLPRPAASQPSRAATVYREQWHLDTAQSPLHTPRSLAITGACELWFADARAGVFRLGCAGGTPTRFGAVGRGDQDYQTPWVVAAVGADSVALFDRTLERVNVYATASGHGRSTPARLPETAFGLVKAMSLAGGAPLFWTMQYPNVTDPAALHSYVTRLASDGVPAETLAMFDGLPSVYWGSSFSGSHLGLPPQRRPVVVFLRSGGFVVGNTDNATIVVHDRTGAEVRTLTLDLPAAAALSRADRDAYADSVRKSADAEMDALHYNQPERKQYRAQLDTYLSEDVTYPDKRQRYDALVVDVADASLWVLLPGSGKSYTRTWEAYSLADGSMQQRVAVPHKGAVVDAQVRDGAIYAIEQALAGPMRVAKYAR